VNLWHAGLMSAAHVQKVADLVWRAAATVSPGTEEDEPWDYGWSIPDYRESQQAALSGPGGPRKLSDDGKALFVEAVRVLLSREEVRARWHKDEIWIVIGSLIIAASSNGVSQDEILEQIRRLFDAPQALNVFSLANIRWEGTPVIVAGAVIGQAGVEVRDAICVAAQVSESPLSEQLGEYIDLEAEGRQYSAIFACRTDGQSRKAHAEARKQFHSIADLALLLASDREALGIFSLRGNTNRPGVRGSVIDRSAVTSIFGGAMRRELVAEPLVISTSSAHRQVYWSSAEPFPLEKLLRIDSVYASVCEALTIAGPVASRLDVSARWFAEAFWSKAKDDAALALGVALDALLGSKSGLPGRAMAERFALLEPTPERRSDRAKRYLEIFSVRSSVAHGGQSSRLDDYRFVRAVENEVSWAARRLLALHSLFKPSSQTEFDAIFEGLRWGTEKWPVSSIDDRPSAGRL
jgi:hypothetical protein